MPRKERLKCGRIPARLFLACHQKSNTFKCKQFCCAKPMYACLFMGCAPRPRQRRAAVFKSSFERRGDGLRSKTHEPVLFEWKRVYRRMCRASRKLYTAAWRCGVSGRSPEFAFLLQAFTFLNKKKMLKCGKYKSLIVVGRDGRG